MTTQEKSRQGFWQSLFGRDGGQEPREEIPEPVVEAPSQEAAPELEIAPNDPIVAYFASASGVVEIEKLDLDSPALRAMKAADIKVVVPLVSQGELIGLLNLGPRLSQQEYSADDRKLLNDLATQTAPAVQVAQLVRQQQQQAQERERIEQELRVARLIQQTLLPKTLPDLPGYELAAYYQPAREVGGDFYDFLELEDGRLGLVVGDVTDKGVPAALVMATTRTLLRASAQRLDSPGEVLKRVNDVLVQRHTAQHVHHLPLRHPRPRDGPPRLRQRRPRPALQAQGRGVAARRSSGRRGCRWGCCRAWSYEEKEIVLERGESVLFYSDGLVEAHDPQQGDVRLPAAARARRGAPLGRVGAGRLPPLRARALHRRRLGAGGRHHPGHPGEIGDGMTDPKPAGRTPTSGGPWPTSPCQASPATSGWRWRRSPRRSGTRVRGENLERLKTAVAEATMNAMEHGNKYRPEVPVEVAVLVDGRDLLVRITDRGSGPPPSRDADTPDLEAKLEGMQTPRGWGLFLIKSMVDEMNISGDEGHHTVELLVHLGAEGGK